MNEKIFELRSDDRPVLDPREILQACYELDIKVAETDSMADLPVAAQWWRDGLDESQHREDALPEAIHDGLTHDNFKAVDGSLAMCNDEQSRRVEKKKRQRRKKNEGEPSVRQRRPKLTKEEIRKNARLRGLEHIGEKGNLVKAKLMGPPCNCRKGCHVKIDEKTRQQLHDNFWNMESWPERNHYISMLVEVTHPEDEWRERETNRPRRVVSNFRLHLINLGSIKVCKQMFLSTFCISETRLRSAVGRIITSSNDEHEAVRSKGRASNGEKLPTIEDHVREHINLIASKLIATRVTRGTRKYLSEIPSISAMYKLYVKECRERDVPDEDIAKESYYRKVFNNESSRDSDDRDDDEEND